MKGFLASYKIKQGNSPGLSINFTLTIKNATYFTVTLDTYAASTIEHITYFRLGYDQTAIERRDKTSVFRDFSF
jgi:hypothetical protein